MGEYSDSLVSVLKNVSDSENMQGQPHDQAKLLGLLTQREREVRALNERAVKLLNERARMIEELEVRNQEVTTLLGIAHSVSCSLDPQRVIEAGLGQIKQSLGVDGCFVYLIEEDRLTLKAQIGISTQTENDLAALVPQDGIVCEVLRSGNPIVINELAADYTDLAALMAGGFGSYIGIPLRVRDEYLGVLGIAFIPKLPPGERELELLSAVGLEMATALQNSMLYQKSREEEQDLCFLSKLTGIISSNLDISQVYTGFIEGLSERMSVDWGSVVLIEEDGIHCLALSTTTPSIRQVGEIITLGGTATEWVAEHKQVLVQDDLIEDQRFTSARMYIDQGVRSIIHLPFVLQDECFGCLILGSRNPHAYNTRDVGLLERLAAQLVPHIMNDRIHVHLQESMCREKKIGEEALQAREDLENATLETVEALVNVVEGHDAFNRGHAEKVAHLCGEMGRVLELSEEDMRDLVLAAELHEVGKIAVSANVLMKSHEDRTPDEVEEFQSYVTKTVELLQHFSFLRGALPYIENHCERLDGSGYPQGLKGDDIPYGARILALCDAYVAMTSERPWRPALGRKEILKIIRTELGSKWDPSVVEAVELLMPDPAASWD